MLRVDDIISELDVLTVDYDALEVFGNSPAVVSTNMAQKRVSVVDDWLYSRLVKAGYSPHNHSVRFAPESALGYTGGVFTDVLEAVTNKTLDDVSLATTLVTVGSDFLYLGMPEAPRKLWLTMQSTPNVNSLTVGTYEYWTGTGWSAMSSLSDATLVNSIAFSGGGQIGWQHPTNWARRSLNDQSTWRYWMRVGANRTPSVPTAISQALPVRRSRLTLPSAYKVMAMMYGEGWGAQRGEWKEKSREYHTMADNMLADALIGLNEFTLPEEEQVVPSSPAAPIDQSLFIIERG
jgi:hypothetical protein